MHPQYSPQDDDEDRQHEALPEEAKDHMWAAFKHKAGIGPHPGLYKGPPIPVVPTEEDDEAEDAAAPASGEDIGGSKPVRTFRTKR